MLVNFALGCVGTEVTCDKVSSDGYEPENLLRHDAGWMQQGFLAERFIKPPVTLTFKFPTPVCLKNIVLDPKVGSQRSTLIEIYTALRRKIWKREQACDMQTSRLDSVRQSDKRSDKGESSQEELEPIFKKIGNIYSSEPGRICFYNPLFTDNSSSSSADSMMKTCPLRVELRHHQSVMLLAADFLTVRIVGTANSSVPAIGRIHIWGQPARSCPQMLRDKVIKNFTEGTSSRLQQNRSVSFPEMQDVSSSPLSTHLPSGDKKDQVGQAQSQNLQTQAIDPSVNIPEEFLDALTFDIMSLPMLLPSGQSIDMSTLDRFSDAEANYGRQPTDPFTGLGFTASRKPIVNMPLKLRIDRFLLEHADRPSLQSVPRALGTSAQSSQTVSSRKERMDTPSRIVTDERFVSRLESQKRKAEIGFQCDDRTANTPATQAGYLPATDISPFTSVQKLKKFKGEEISTQNTSCNKPSSSAEEVKSYGVNTSHEDRLKSSLSSSLSSVLRGLPVFTNTSDQSLNSRGNSPKPDLQCSSCKTHLKTFPDQAYTASTQAAYSLPCQHKVCRTCLLKTDAGDSVVNITCWVCKRQFSRSDVERTHINYS